MDRVITRDAEIEVITTVRAHQLTFFARVCNENDIVGGFQSLYILFIHM